MLNTPETTADKKACDLIELSYLFLQNCSQNVDESKQLQGHYVILSSYEIKPLVMNVHN